MSQPPFNPQPQGQPAPGTPPYPPYTARLPTGAQPYGSADAPRPPWPPSQPPYEWQPYAGQPQFAAQAPAPKPFYKKPWFIVVAVIVVLGAIGSAMDEDTTTAARSTESTPTVATEPVETPAAPTTEAAPPSAQEPVVEAPPTVDAAPVVDFVMPNLVGVDLQTAQNTVQDNGVFLSVSHDLLGSRNQALDSNWMVCTQNIAAGERVTGDVEGQIDFGVVKRGESCP
jgi:hypothetical protein